MVERPILDVAAELSSAEAVLGSGGTLSTIRLEAWEHRAGQLEMARAIERRIAEGGVLVVEAPTGTGKTLGYLVPALSSGQRVIVSTHTKNLQDQIAKKDIPMLADAMPAFSSCVMKGRANYLCLLRMEKRHRQQSFDFDFDQLSEIAAWARETKTGDRAELRGLPAVSPLWSELDARGERCVGQRCDLYDDCFVVKMRAEAEASDVVIVNHHLLFAELAMRARARLSGRPRFGEVIPPADVLIVDEAHAIESIASEYFGGSVSSGQVERLQNDLLQLPNLPQVVVERAVGAARSLFAALPLSQDGRMMLRPGNPAHRRLAPCLSALAELEAHLTISEEPLMTSLAERTKQMADSLKFVLAADDPDYVYWCERRPKNALIGASPVDVARLCREHLFGAFETVVVTSATLADGPDCSFYRRSVGVPEEAEELVLDSPFDYRHQAALYLPSAAPDPRSERVVEETAAIGKAVIELLEGGALFLFTSHRMMRAVHDALAPQLTYPTFLQGAQPRQRLLESFVESAPAVLFGTASFWEGVDVPGDALRLVLIDKLPFDPPNDPLIQAKSRRVENAFMTVQLPRAVLRLKQGFGRLVRRRTDRGVVAVLDRRLWTKGYGRRFLDALPDAQRVDDLRSLEDWWCTTSAHR